VPLASSGGRPEIPSLTERED